MTPPDPLGALGHFPLMINKPLQQSYALRLCVSVSVSPLLCQCPDTWVLSGCTTAMSRVAEGAWAPGVSLSRRSPSHPPCAPR